MGKHAVVGGKSFDDGELVDYCIPGRFSGDTFDVPYKYWKLLKKKF